MTPPDTAALTDPRIDLAARDVRPVVIRPRSGLPTPLLLLIGIVLAVALFLYLDSRRRALLASERAETAVATNLPGPPPPLAVPLPPPIERSAPPPAVGPPVYAPPQVYRPVVPAASDANRNALPVIRRLGGSDALPRGGQGAAMVIDLTVGSGAQLNGTVAAGPGLQGGADGGDAARATLIRNRPAVIPQGAIIAAVLETPLNSDQPGLARAVVSREARGFDGEKVLIPRGSRLIGEFKADNSPGMHRVLVIWNRLIRPDGIAIRIGSPATGPMGQAGIGGRVDTHFVERFASALLQSALTVGVNLASTRSSSNNAIYVGLPTQAAQLGQQLVPNVNRSPTVKVKEGAEIAVLVARDLDFSGAPPLQ